MNQAILIIANVPDADTASEIARQLVEKRLAACVNIMAPIHSIYRWKETIEEATEIPLLIKTRKDLYEMAESAIVEMHPYEVPEVIMLPIMKGFPSYLEWVCEETGLSDKQS